MSGNMDSVDKNFFLHLFGQIDKRLDTVDAHLVKTCDEIKEVRDSVIELNLKDKISEDINDKKFLKRINKPQWIMTGAALITLVAVLFNIGID